MTAGADVVLGWQGDSLGKDDARFRQLADHVKEIWQWCTFQERTWRDRLGEGGLLGLSAAAFERVVADEFKRIGATVVATGGTGDGGVDLRLTYSGNRILVQCKRFRQPVGPAVVRDLRGAMQDAGITRGILVAASGFSSSARDFADRNGIALIDGASLATLDIGVLLSLGKSDT
jgi:hypothetical protein